MRYGVSAASWAVGIVGLLLFDAWCALDTSKLMPNVKELLGHFVRWRLPLLVLATLLVSLVPLPENMWLGTAGEPLLAPLAPLLLLISTGLVVVFWWVVMALMWPLSHLHKLIPS